MGLFLDLPGDGGDPPPPTGHPARFWLGAATPDFPNAHSLGALATGLVKNTSGTPSIAVAGTDYQAPLADVITAQSYANPDSITVTAKGIVTAITAGAAKALQSTTISAGDGLTGGGSLAANRTISMPNVGPGAGSIGGGGNVIQSITLDAQGRVTAATAGAAIASAYQAVENNGTPVTQRSTLNLSTEFTATDTASKTAVALTTNGVTYAKLAQAAGLSVLGVTGASTADLAAITGTASQVLRVNGAGTALAFGLIANGNIDAAAAIDITKLGNLAGASVLGRAGAGTGAMAAITGSTPGHVLTVQGDGTLAFSAGGASGYTTVENNGSAVTQRSTINLSTEFTATDSASKTALALTTNGVGFSKLAQLAAVSVLGVTGGSTANMAAITASADGQVLRRTSSSALAFGTLVAASFADGTITGARMTGFTDTRLTVANSSGALTDSTITLSSNVLTHAASSTGTVSAVVSNTNTGASANALVQAMVASGGTSADPILQASISGGASVMLAIDNSDSDAAVISLGSAPGTSNVFRALASGGEVSVRTTTNNIVMSMVDGAGVSFGFAQHRHVWDTSAGGFLFNAGYAWRVNTAGSANSGNQNMEFFGATAAYGSGVKVLMWNNCTTAPSSTNPSGGGFEYWESGIRKIVDPTGMVVSLN